MIRIACYGAALSNLSFNVQHRIVQRHILKCNIHSLNRLAFTNSHLANSNCLSLAIEAS